MVASDAFDALLRVIGAFYAFGGFMAVRAGLASRMLDVAVGAVSANPPNAAQTGRTYWLLAGSVLIAAGGVALLLLLDLAPWLFVASASGQLLYLAWVAPRYFDPGDPPDASGRRQTTNAFVLYLVPTALTVWAASAGRLQPWGDVHPALLAAGSTGIVVLAVYTLWGLHGRSGAVADVSVRSGQARLQPREIKLEAVAGCHPLWAIDAHLVGDIDPADLALSSGLVADLARWSAEVCGETEACEKSGRAIAQARLEHLVQHGRELAARVKGERPDLTVYIDEPGYGPIMVEARGGAGEN